MRASVALPADPEERPSVVCRGDWFSPSGFGETARLTFRALESAGLRPQALSVPKDSIQVPSLWPQACHATGKNADIILHLLPPDMYDFSLPGRHYGYFLWETDRLDPAHSPLHQRWAESLNRLDEVWIPSQFLENVLRNSGVTRPVRLVPYPIDTRQYLVKAECLQTGIIPACRTSTPSPGRTTRWATGAGRTGSASRATSLMMPRTR